MRLYESVIIARQDVSTTQVETLIDEFSAIIEKAGGSIHKKEFWGLRGLAYRIKKNRKGHYVMLNIETDSETLNEFERIMGLNEDVLRFMTIAIEEVDPEPSVMMQVKTERGGKERRDDRRDDRSRSKTSEDAPQDEEE
ncbi:MAG: 30S ribosomal protein S6 [Alphaproteobacteria bacterium]|jgi:small subunit ribosomal protein S6|nr:30S ribosomal protein S6 [Alphaproteobacteria bacterium]